MTFRLGAQSQSRLIGVDLGLVAVVRRAIDLTEQDFGVYEGLRDASRQRKLFAAGASRTLNSYHLPDAGGIGHAVDLVPYIDGRLQWQDAPCLVVAKAMHSAASELDVDVTWGAVWDRPLRALDRENLAREIRAYLLRYERRHGPDKDPLIDRPHFQVPREALEMAA